MSEKNKFELLKDELGKIISKSTTIEDPGHSRLTLEWVLKLKPDADEALRIAALAHDIDRAVNGSIEDKLPKDLPDIAKVKQQHALRSADITCRMMAKLGYDDNIVKKVRYLIENHESGGNEEANILMNADCMSFFEHNIYFYVKKKGKEKTKNKIRWICKRMSPEAKRLVRETKFKSREIRVLFEEAVSGF